MIYNPVLYDENGQGTDVLSLNLKNRNIFLVGEINDEMAASIISQLLYLDSAETGPITLYINSPGGMVSAGLAIYDTMRSLRNDIRTICVGNAASMAAVILSGGKISERYILPHAAVMIHQPSGGAGGQASDIIIAAKRIEYLQQELNKLLAENCGKRPEELEDKTDRDFWMNAKQAVEFGIVDRIIGERK